MLSSLTALDSAELDKAVATWLPAADDRARRRTGHGAGLCGSHRRRRARRLLHETANSLLAVVRRAHPLKDWARTSHKKACAALARKRAVILHRMVMTGEPFRWPATETPTA